MRIHCFISFAGLQRLRLSGMPVGIAPFTFDFILTATVIGILVDMSGLTDVTMIQSAWSLLSELYAVVDQLKDMSEDRRTLHAAKSVIATWYECRQKPGLTDMEKPEFVSQLEEILTETEGIVIEDTNDKDAPMSSLLDFGQGRAGEDDLQPFGFEFADIDWAFWDSIS